MNRSLHFNLGTTFIDGPYSDITWFYKSINRTGKTVRHQQMCPECGRTLVNTYRKDGTWKCKKCWDKEDARPDLNDMVRVVWDHERQCKVCLYNDGECKGGVRGGPNGPIFPPCADLNPEDYVDEDLLREVYDEIMEEENEQTDRA